MGAVPDSGRGDPPPDGRDGSGEDDVPVTVRPPTGTPPPTDEPVEQKPASTTASHEDAAHEDAAHEDAAHEDAEGPRPIEDPDEYEPL